MTEPLVEGDPNEAAVNDAALDPARPLEKLETQLRQLTAEGGEFALVKMDIEGAEQEILESLEAQGLFERVRCLIVETHERKFKDQRPRYRALRERVAASPHAHRIFLNWI